MQTNFNNRTRTRLIGLVFLGLVVRVFMPAGYMPAPVSEGGPFVPCPSGIVGANIFQTAEQTANHQHGHDTDEGHNSDAWEFCPFGAVFGSAAPVAEPATSELAFDKVQSPPISSSTIQSLTVYIRRARGPPTPKPLYI